MLNEYAAKLSKKQFKLSGMTADLVYLFLHISNISPNSSDIRQAGHGGDDTGKAPVKRPSF